MARGLDRLGPRGRSARRIAVGNLAVDGPVVLLLGEQIAALPALTPVVLTGVAVEIVGPGFGGDRDSQTGGVAETAVESVVEDFHFGYGTDRRQVGGITAIAIAEGAVDSPDVAADSTAIGVVGPALRRMRTENLRRSASGLHARAELNHAGDHVGHYRQVADGAAVHYGAVVGTSDIDQGHFGGDGHALRRSPNLKHDFDVPDIAGEQHDALAHLFFEAGGVDGDRVLARHQQGHDEAPRLIRFRAGWRLRVEIRHENISADHDSALGIFHGPLNGATRFLGAHYDGEAHSDRNEAG